MGEIFRKIVELQGGFSPHIAGRWSRGAGAGAGFARGDYLGNWSLVEISMILMRVAIRPVSCGQLVEPP